MTNPLKIQLLGAPQLFLHEQLLDVQRQKGLAMLIYLAVTGGAQQRDTLAALFWPESDQSRARASLRRDLSVLNKLLAEEWLEIEREWVALRPGYWLDVNRFRELLAEWRGHGHAAEVVCSACLPALQTAVSLYHNDFLTGFSLPNCPEFDEWQFFQAQELRQSCFAALEKLVRGLTAQGEIDAALPNARRWVALEPAHEPAHRQLMRLYARSGQPAAAVRQYQLCVQTLQEELGVDPQPETTALYEQIRRQPPAATNDAPPRLVAGETPRRNIPTPATPFVGRLAGLTEISARLEDPACRLLTLLGPGGIGKTRLAIETARRFAAPSANLRFPHGVYFVRLGSATRPEHLLSAVAAALNLTFYRDLAPQRQLLDFLAEKQVLLVLDNLEQLLVERPSSPDSTTRSLLTDLLTAAPGLKLLVTSREALNLQEEWIVPVDGMRFPLGLPAAEADLTAYSAVRLFVESARRVNPDFDLAEDRECVLQIIRLVEGTPLALELAAGWLKLLPLRANRR